MANKKFISHSQRFLQIRWGMFTKIAEKKEYGVEYEISPFVVNIIHQCDGVSIKYISYTYVDLLT